MATQAEAGRRSGMMIHDDRKEWWMTNVDTADRDAWRMIAAMPRPTHSSGIKTLKGSSLSKLTVGS